MAVLQELRGCWEVQGWAAVENWIISHHGTVADNLMIAVSTFSLEVVTCSKVDSFILDK